MPPKRLKLKITRRNGGDQSSQQDDTVGSPSVDNGTAISAKGSDSAIDQFNGLAKAASSGTYIKQEPTSGTTKILSAATSSIASTSATTSVPGGRDDGSSSLGKPHDPSSTDLDNNTSSTTTMVNTHIVPSRNNHGSHTSCSDSDTAASPINEFPDVSKMNDKDLGDCLEHSRSEESRLLKMEAQGVLAEFYSRRTEKVRRCIKELEEELNRRQVDITRAMKASKNLMRSQLSVPGESETQRDGKSRKRTLRQRKADNQPDPDARPVKRPKISKETHRIKDTVMKGVYSRIKGETSATLDKDATKDLPQIEQAPVHLRGQLQAIKNAATETPGVDKNMVDHDLCVFSGILRAVFGRLIQPWVSPGDGPKKVGDYKWRLLNMIEPLHNHQLPAIGVMIMSEKDNEKDEVVKFALKSGFLFDYMGLGKTVEILGCIVVNMPHFRMNQRSKTGLTTTLIVVPKSAVLQWQSEAQHHCPSLKISLYKKECEEEPLKALSNDILLVTYEQLLSAAGPKSKKQSFLFKSEFFRLVLDESHRIKNRASETFKACCKLQAKHRWCASGTPTPNGVAELYSYLKFIRHPLVDEFPAFRDKYLGGKKGLSSPNGAEKKYEELDQLLEHVMIMRIPGHQLLGGPLFDLPKIHYYTPSFSLSPEEAIIYEYLEKHITEYIIKKSEKTPRPKKQSSRPSKKPQGETSAFEDEGLGFKSLCEVALRFRQLVASPLLLEQIVRDGVWTSEQVREMKHEAHSRGCAQTTFIDHFEAWVSQPMVPRSAWKKMDRKEQKRIELNRLCCPGCHTARQENPHMSRCHCTWCKGCFDDRIDLCKLKERELLCPRCRSPMGTPQPCGLPGDAERPRMRGEDVLRFQPKEDFGATLFQDLDADSGAAIPLSSKMHAILGQIRAWQAIAPEDKIILFFQFIGTQKLLGRVFQDEGIEFLYFVGEMDNKQREAAKKCFQSDRKIKVMASSILKSNSLRYDTLTSILDDFHAMWRRGSQPYGGQPCCHRGPVVQSVCGGASDLQSRSHRPEQSRARRAFPSMRHNRHPDA